MSEGVVHYAQLSHFYIPIGVNAYIYPVKNTVSIQPYPLKRKPFDDE